MPFPPVRRTLRAALLATAMAAAAVLIVAGPASAHVTVHADDARPGTTDSVLTFRVPDEEANATTVKVAISFPTRNPLPSVKPATKPGWTVATTTSTFNPPITTDDGTLTNGVTQVVYTAKTPSDAIGVGAFDTFQVLVGPLPGKPATLAFPTLQTYSDGKTVSWIQPITDPANEPDFPAPTLEVTGAVAAGSPAVAVAAGSSATASTAPSSSDDATARTLGVTGIAIGVIGVLFGVIATVRARTAAPRTD
jgi:uncharacterized protein YcnI